MKRLIGLLLATLSLTGYGCMTLPPGVSVVVTDAPEVHCGDYVNCYNPLTRTIVLVPGQSLRVLAHEGCHAHQHRTVLDAGMTASRDLREWYATDEAAAYYSASVAPRPTDWRLSADNLMEDFAESCARFLIGMSNEPGREAFFSERSFR